MISKQGVGFTDPETKVGPVRSGSGASGCGVVCKVPDPTTLSTVQEELDMYPFSRITHYHSRDERFHMTLKTVRKGSNFVCETAHVSERKERKKPNICIANYPNIPVPLLPLQAEIMEELLRSYISVYERQRLPPGTASFSQDYYDDFF